ncbi:MAG: hypothetical protein HY644_06205 [Acidobacteria bacterium]|nr:hypothetical protein [Acidobacteriota bacterium]
MAVREFLGDYEKRRKELDRVLTQGRQIERNFFIDPSFLKEVASLVEEDVSRATVLLASNILAARG